MAICPIISTKGNKSDCIGSKCDFFDGCMILDAYKTANECSTELESVKEDADFALVEANSVRADHDDLVRELG